jgi:glycosyltransferase involved in cell wall biosynthesis
MRILFVTPAYDCGMETDSGVARCTGTMARALVKRGHNVSVYTTTSTGTGGVIRDAVPGKHDNEGVELWYFQASLNPSSTFMSRTLATHLKANIQYFDLVYVAALWQWTGVQTYRMCKKYNVPLIVGIHGGFSRKLRKHSRLRKWIFYQLFHKKQLRSKPVLAAHVTCEHEAREATHWLRDVPLLVCPNAVEPNAFCLATEKIMNSNNVKINTDTNPKRMVVWAGRLVRRKRVDRIIRALEFTSDWELSVIGNADRGMGPSWQNLAKEVGVQDRVHWNGYRSGDHLLASLRRGDVMILVSDNENFGLSVIEAMMVGLPILVTVDVGVVEYIDGVYGAYTTSPEPHAIAQALDAIPRQLERGRIREEALKLFSPSAVASKFTQEVEKLLYAAST